jgi:sulfoxide reductase heme-binding subunit YedZ
MRRHLALATLTLAASLIPVYALSSKSPAFRLSMGSAYVSLALLAATLCLGPWNVVRNRANPLSTHVRRDLGIWAAIAGLVHVIAGLQVHMRGRFWLYFIPNKEPSPVFFRTDFFGFANLTGLLATTILILLLALSSDRVMARLGGRRWKRWQRSSYLLALLVVAHGFAYQAIEGRQPILVAAFSGVVALVLLAQLLGLRQTHRDRARVETAQTSEERCGSPSP